MPRALILLDNLDFGGQQLLFLRLASRLAARGWELQLMYSETQTIRGDLREEWERCAKLEALLGAGGLRQPAGWIPNLRNLLRARTAVVQFGADVILCGSSWTRAIASVVGPLTSVPTVNLPGSSWYLSPFYRLWSRISGPIHACQAYISFGGAASAEFQRLGIERRRILETHHGTDLERFRPDHAARACARQQLGYSDGSVVLGFGGRLSEEKGLEALLTTFATVAHASARDWRLLLVGDGPSRARLRDLAAQLRVADRVTITGVVREPVTYYRAMDCAAQYSLEPHGGKFNIGTFTVEALACGVPVLHFAPPEVCEAYQEGVSGFYVGHAGFPQQLEAVLRRFDADPDLSRTLGASARRLAQERFDIEDTMKLIATGLDRLVAGRWPDGSPRA